MNICELTSWTEFQDELGKLTTLFEKRHTDTGLHVSAPLFRGQSDHRWPLATTLERYGLPEISLRDYYLAALKSKHLIESFTGKRWDVPDLEDYKKYLAERDTFMYAVNTEYDYMVYLRHNGFPSPLLDWSASPYVAAFFAFDKAKETEPDGRVAIYVYCEYFGTGKMHTQGSPELQYKGPYVTSHPRHFKQQSSYTLCIARSDEWHYTPHESAFAAGEASQDLLWKFTIPSNERRKVLTYLDSHNDVLPTSIPRMVRVRG